MSPRESLQRHRPRPPPSEAMERATSIYRMDSEQDQHKALELCNSAHPHIIRIVGSLPGEQVVRATSKALLTALRDLAVGPIFIGGTESHKKGDPGSPVYSIPALARRLQALSYQSQRHGLVAPVFGTIPINAHSNLIKSQVSSDPLVAVKIAKGLQRAMLFPTDREYLWDAEAHGMRNVVERALQRSGAHISVIFVGGGNASELEFQLMSDLKRESPNNVSLIGLAGSGGITESLIQKRQLDGIELKGSKLREQLQIHSCDASGMHNEPENLDRLRSEHYQPVHNALELILQRGARRVGAIDAVDSDTLMQLHREFAGCEADLQELIDYWRAGATITGSLERKDRRIILDRRVERYQVTLIDSGHIPVLGNVGPGYNQIAARVGGLTFLSRCAEHLNWMEPNAPSLTDLVSKVDRVRTLPAGTMMSIGSARSIVLSDKFVLTAESYSGQLRLRYEPSISLFGEVTPFSFTSALTAPLVQRPLAHYPDAIPGWKSLQNGGLIQYIDRTGKVVAHEEVLKVSDSKPDGTPLVITDRWVEALRVNHETQAVEYVTEVRPVVSLSIPDGWIHARCARIAVYPYTSATSVVGESTSFPGTDVERRGFGATALCEAALSAFVERMTDSLVTAGALRARRDVEELTATPTEATITGLRGADPNFEKLLQDHKAFFEEVRDFKANFRLLTARLVYSPIANPERCLAQLQAALMRHNSQPEQVFTDLATELQKIDIDPVLQEKLIGAVHQLGEQFRALVAQPEYWSQAKGMELYRGEAPQALISECVEIAKKFELSDNHQGKDLSKALRALGGFITNEYTADYFKSSIANGATLAVSRNRAGGIEALALYYPAGNAPGELLTLYPELFDQGAGYYDLLCCAPGCSPDSSVALNRAIFVSLQHSPTDNFIAINHESNEPAIRASLGMGDHIGGSSTVVRTLDGVTTKYLQINAPVSAYERLRKLPGAAVTRAQQNIVVRRVRQQIQSPSSGTVNSPTPDELAQMRQLSTAYEGKGFYRLSLGVASMTPEAAGKLKHLVARGFFDTIDGLVVVGAGRLAEKRGDDWIIRDGDALSLVGAIRERNPQAIPVGMAPYNIAEPSHGLSQKVISPDLVERDMAVLLSEQAGQMSVADHSQSLVIMNPVTIDKTSGDNLDVWHVEALRAMSLAGHFSEPIFIFGAGGGVIAWEIETVLRAITDGQLPDGRVVFLKGLEGSTDRLADHPTIAKMAAEYKTKTGRDLITVVDVTSDAQEIMKVLSHATTPNQPE